MNSPIDTLVLNLLEMGYDFQKIMDAISDGADSDEQVLDILNKNKLYQEKFGETLPSENNFLPNPKEEKKYDPYKNLEKKPIKHITVKLNSNQKADQTPTIEEYKIEENLPKKLKLLKNPNTIDNSKSKLNYYEFNPPILNPSKKPAPKIKFPKSPKKPFLSFFSFPTPPDPFQSSKRYSLYLSEKSISKPEPSKKTLPPKPTPPTKYLPSNFPVEKNPSPVPEPPVQSLSNIYISPPKSAPPDPLLQIFSFSSFFSKKQNLVLNQPDANDPVAPDPNSNYFSELSEYRMFQSSDPANFGDYCFTEPVELSPGALKRINAEIKTLTKNLPCDKDAAIFFMYDSDDVGKMKALVTGPAGTVYAHGCFLFDIRIPHNYPNEPPLVMIRTTGNGYFRFNPNLYPNGKVCLSIINTWTGHGDEKWNPTNSNLMQVFLSIQALVMGNKIIQNEPGFEDLSENSVENVLYQYEVKYGTLKYALVDMYRHPPKGFEDIVKKHMKMKKEEIMNTAIEWMQSCQEYRPYPQYKSQNPELQNRISKDPYKIFQKHFFELDEILDQLSNQ